MKTYLCEEMMCGHCVARIQQGLKTAGIEHTVNLDEKTVMINDDSRTKEAVEILDDMGFSAKELS